MLKNQNSLFGLCMFLVKINIIYICVFLEAPAQNQFVVKPKYDIGTLDWRGDPKRQHSPQ